MEFHHAPAELVEEVKWKKELLKQYNTAYYQTGVPLVADEVYDKIFLSVQKAEEEYPSLLAPDSPTQTVGAPVTSGFPATKHTVPMLSIRTETDNSEQGAADFVARVEKQLPGIRVVYYAEPKYDGLAVSLRYEKGFLVSGSTRGDGFEGEDLTPNIKTISDIPHKLAGYNLPEVIEVRGEVYMSKAALKQLNTSGQKQYANTRNAASGALRQTDPEETRRRKLSFFAYSIGEVKGISFKSQEGLLETLKDYGFPVHVLSRKCTSAKELNDFHKEVGLIRPNLEVDIDGVVYKVNDFSLQNKLGFVSREPRWAVAHKYPAEKAGATVLGIETQVGRTGKITLVAKLTPTAVGGVIVSSATLHNAEEIARKDIRIGCLVSIARAGDVIPEVVEVIEPYPEGCVVYTAPARCPFCNSPIEKEDESVDQYCTGGINCPAQLRQAMIHFCSKRAMNIEGLGDQTIIKMIDVCGVTTFADIYRIAPEDLLIIDRVSDGVARKHKDAINKSKTTTLARFLFALGIRHVGESTAKLLARNFNSIEEISTASQSEFEAIESIGPVLAESLVNYFTDYTNMKNIHALLSAGITFTDAKEEGDDTYKGMTVVVTGSFPDMNRDQIKAALEAKGAKVASGLSRKTDLLLVGDAPSNKYEKAKALGIKIITSI